MRDLTAADVAFLLCSTKLGTFNLTLSTDFGLFLDISSDGTITAGREKQNMLRSRRRSTGPITPVSPVRDSIDAVMFTPTSNISTSFPTSCPLSNLASGTTTPYGTQYQRESLTQTSTSGGKKQLSIVTIHPPSIPTPESTPPAVMSHPGYKYIITPAFGHQGARKQTLIASSTSNYIFYSPSSAHNPRSSTLSSLQTSTSGSLMAPGTVSKEIQPSEIAVREEDLEARYSSSSGPGSGNWLDSYLDWVLRSQRAYARQRRREERRSRETQMARYSRSYSSGSASSSSSGSSGEEGKKSKQRSGKEAKGPFKDEGESTLWMVEGLLLAAWLCLQDDCAGVEYAPWGLTRGYNLEGKGDDDDGYEVYSLDKNNVGCVMRKVL
ncbi:hypothetical protein V8F20_011751 [Naviculisporaceae sp. PSN 640]